MIKVRLRTYPNLHSKNSHFSNLITSNNNEKIVKIKIWVSSVLHIGKSNFKVEYLLNYWFVKKVLIFGFCLRISVYGEFFIKKFRMPSNGKDPKIKCIWYVFYNFFQEHAT